MLATSILVMAISLSVSQMDSVIILRRGDIPPEGSGVSAVWIEYEVRHSAGTISKMYLTYVHTSVQTIPGPGSACTVIYRAGLVNGIIYGTDNQLVGSPLEEALIIERLSCQED